MLRDYQKQAVLRLIDRLHDNPILVAPTGSGKTVILSELCRVLDLRVLWIAHRRELIRQAAEHLERAGCRSYQATSIQKQSRRPVPDDAGLIVVDECHHAVSSSTYARLFDAGVPVVGATATPFRLDGRGLGDLFGSLVVAARVQELVEAGYLYAPEIFSHEAPDMGGAKKIGGDWSLKELGARTNRPKLVANLVSTWRKRSPGRTLAFATTIEHSKTIVEEFQKAGVMAEHLDGKTPKPERDAILERLRAGTTEIVSNVGVATEGFDMPALDCAIVARPTASLCLWLQMIGRVMRPEGSALILDHSGNALRHGAPTRYIDYVLEPNRRQEPAELGLKLCKTCYLMVPTGIWTCPGCGADMSPTARAQIAIKEGELVPYVDRLAVWNQVRDEKEYKKIMGEWPIIIDGNFIEPVSANKRMIYEHFMKEAREKGYKDGWASHRYRAAYGCWPAGFVTEVKNKMGNSKWKEMTWRKGERADRHAEGGTHGRAEINEKDIDGVPGRRRTLQGPD